MILSGDHKRIISQIDRLHRDVKNIIISAMDIAYASKGALQYHAALQMTAIERDIAIEFLNKKIKEESKLKDVPR